MLTSVMLYRLSLESKSQILAIVIVPARELALQTSSIAKELGAHLNLQVCVCEIEFVVYGIEHVDLNPDRVH